MQDRNPASLLNNALKHNHRKIDRYVQELPAYQSETVLILDYEKDQEFTGRLSKKTTTAILSEAHTQTAVGFLRSAPPSVAQTLALIPKMAQTSVAEAGQYLITNGDELRALMDSPDKIQPYMLEGAGAIDMQILVTRSASLHQQFHQYARFAEKVVGCHDRFYPHRSWDYERDDVRIITGHWDSREQHRKAYDKFRLSKALDFYPIAKLILHLKEAELQAKQACQGKQSSSQALILVQTSSDFQPKLDTKYPNILSENHINSLIHSIINSFYNAMSLYQVSIYEQESYRLDTILESKEQHLAYATLILTSNIRNLFTAVQLASLCGALTFYFGEDISLNNIQANISRHQGPRLMIEAGTHAQFGKYCLDDKSALNGQTLQYLANLAPHFSLDLLTNALKQDAQSAECLFAALFYNQHDYDQKYQPGFSKSAYTSHWYLVKCCGLFAYDDLVSICTAHLSEAPGFFDTFYQQLTGRTKEEFFAQPSSASTDETARAFTSLELNLSQSFQDVKKNYRKLALRWHPDKCTALPDSAEYNACVNKFREVSEAYELLTRYFANLSTQEESAKQAKTEDVSDPEYRSEVVLFAINDSAGQQTREPLRLMESDVQLQVTLTQGSVQPVPVSLPPSRLRRLSIATHAVDVPIRPSSTQSSSFKLGCQILAMGALITTLSLASGIGIGLACAWWTTVAGFFAVLIVGQQAAIAVTAVSIAAGVTAGFFAGRKCLSEAVPLDRNELGLR